MRHLLLAIAVLSVAAGLAAAEEHVNAARTTIGDVPRTYSHFMNAQEAALCRANAATGGVSSYFFNPGSLSELEGLAGYASMRFNLKDRAYFDDEGDNALEASDDALLFSQAVAAKSAEAFTYGFGYSCPAYRNLEVTGRSDGAPYEGDFQGSLRFFEVLAATRIGKEGMGGIGVAVGVASLSESAREAIQRSLSSASLDGIATSFALGMVFDPTDRLTFGVGYRFGTEFDVDGDWNTSDPPAGASAAKGTTTTQSVAVGGVRVRFGENFTVYTSYIQEGWGSAKSSFAAYYPTEEPDARDEQDNDRNEFEGDLGTAAIGVEGTIMEGRLTLRGGFSTPVKSDFSNDAEPEYRELAPEYAAGLGATLRFQEYEVDAAFVRESFADGDEGKQAVNHGIYLTVGYSF